MMNDANNDPAFTRKVMQEFFSVMGDIAHERQEILEVAIYGGSALALSFDWRTSTHDVDYTPVRGAEADIQEIARLAAAKMGLPEDGLRSDVQIFVSDYAELIQNGEYPKGMPDGFGLRVFTASPDYILAMKLLSMRSSLETQDCRDVWHLMEEAGIKTIDEALERVARFYPGDKVPLRNRRIAEDLFEAKARGENYSAIMGY